MKDKSYLLIFWSSLSSFLEEMMVISMYIISNKSNKLDNHFKAFLTTVTSELPPLPPWYET